MPGRVERTHAEAVAGATGAVARENMAITPTKAASSSAVGTPRTTRKAGTWSGFGAGSWVADIFSGYVVGHAS